jgi:hypothetical protein
MLQRLMNFILSLKELKYNVKLIEFNRIELMEYIED